MTYETREQSRDSGEPIEFVQFARDGFFWRYTSDTEDQVFRGNLYTALPGFFRGPIEQSDEPITMQLQLTLPRTATIAAEFIGSPWPAAMRVIVYRNHRGEPTGAGVRIWSGRVAGASFDRSDLVLACTTVEAVFKSQVGKHVYARECPYMLGDALCGVDLEGHTFDATITARSLDGRTVTVTGPGDLGATPSHYASGVFLADPRRSLIRSEAAGVLILQTPLVGLEVGQAVRVQRGCARTAAVCEDVFDNLDRRGAFPRLPLRDVWKRLT